MGTSSLLSFRNVQFPIAGGRAQPRHRGSLSLSPSPASCTPISKRPLRARIDTRSLSPLTALVYSHSRYGEIRSCSGDPIVAAEGGGDGRVPPFCGGGRRGGGGEEESSNARGDDGDHLLLVRSFLMLADHIMRVLRVLISTPEGAVFSVLGVIADHDLQENTDNSQWSPPSYSSSSLNTESLEIPESFDAASSHIVTMSPMEIDGTNSGYNHDAERRSMWNKLIQFLNNHLPIYGGSSTASVVGPVRNPTVNRKKGLLGSFYTIAEKLYVFCAALLIWSWQYPLGARARLSFDDREMKGIIIASTILLCISLVLSPLSSFAKESESIDGSGIGIFKWLLVAILLGLWAELCAILRFCASIPSSIVWSLGVLGSLAIMLIWAWVFYAVVPQAQMDSSDSEPATNALLNQPPV